MCCLLAPSAHFDRRLERLSGEHPPSIPREGQANGRSGTSELADLAAVVYRHSDQANGKKRVVEVTRRMAHGLLSHAEHVLQASRGGSVLNTAITLRLSGTFRERLASLTRKSRHAARRLRALETGMYLIGCIYNFCFAHHELSKTKHIGSPCTPAVAAGLTDHVWSISELLSFHIAPLPWVASAKRGRPKKSVALIKNASPRPLVRLRKGVLCYSTV
jgi:hypothetical protein